MNSSPAKSKQIKDYLEFGMKLSILIKFGPRDEYTLQSTLIGMKEGQFLLLDLAPKAVEDLITRKTNNVPVVIRGITDTELGDIIAFKSQIITVVSRPTWLMFVKLPYNFETKPIRANKRFKLSLPVEVIHEGESHKAILRDLSSSGCGILFEKPIELAKGMDVTIKPALEHFPETSPICNLVNVRKLNNGLFVGIKFDQEIELVNNLKYEIFEHAIVNR